MLSALEKYLIITEHTAECNAKHNPFYSILFGAPFFKPCPLSCLCVQGEKRREG